MRVDYANKALADIGSILQYIDEMWGSESTDEYRDVLRKAFDLIGEYPDIGHRVERKPDSFREFSIQHHVIRYLRESDRVVILRLLAHRQRRD